MGRHDTVAWQRIIALCTIYGVDINDIKKKSKKILSLYSDLVVLKRAKEDEFSFLYPCPPLDYMKALDILDKLDPDQGIHDLSIIIYTFEYGIGIIIDEDTKEFDQADLEKKGFRIWDVTPGTYVVFDCVGEDGDCIAKTWVKFYKEFLPQMGYEASEQTDYELYFDGTRPDVFCELWIPIKKK